MLTTEEQERLAYVTGDTDTAALLARIDHLESVISRASQMLAITDAPGANDDVIDLLKGASA